MLPDLLLLSHLKFVDFQLAIEFLLNLIHHEAHLSDVVLHFIIIDLHLGQLPFSILQLLICLVDRIVGFHDQVFSLTTLFLLLGQVFL